MSRSTEEAQNKNGNVTLPSGSTPFFTPCLLLVVRQGGHDERTSLIEDEQRRQVAQLDAQIDYSSSLIQEREEGIKEIEATMLDHGFCL